MTAFRPERTPAFKRSVSQDTLASANIIAAKGIRREWDFISALHEQGVAVPEPLHLCEDPRILGAPFYLMEYIEVRTLVCVSHRRCNATHCVMHTLCRAVCTETSHYRPFRVQKDGPCVLKRQKNWHTYIRWHALLMKATGAHITAEFRRIKPVLTYMAMLRRESSSIAIYIHLYASLRWHGHSTREQ
jgi:hypothetical protein